MSNSLNNLSIDDQTSINIAVEDNIQKHNPKRSISSKQFYCSRNYYYLPNNSLFLPFFSMDEKIGIVYNNDNSESLQTEWIDLQQQYNHQHKLNRLDSCSSESTTTLEGSLNKFLDMDLDNGQRFSENNRNYNEINLPTMDDLMYKLNEFDTLQAKYYTTLLLPKDSKREVTSGGRDGSAYVLRCLKMWYELPSDVLFAAINLVDRFLSKMSVKPKHMACMSVASFYLAIKQLELKEIPPDDLVMISQCGCTAGDLERMAEVIANKLGVQIGHPPITSLSYLRVYFGLFRNMTMQQGGQLCNFYRQFIKLEELEMRLEVLLCDVQTTVMNPSSLALVLICLHLDLHIKESYHMVPEENEFKQLFDYILNLQQLARIPDRIFTNGFNIVSSVLNHYNGQQKQPYKQRLVWKLSSRTLRVLRPTNRFSTDLTTIEEAYSNIDENSRPRNESISSEEEEDWPTSPIIPIFEQF